MENFESKWKDILDNAGDSSFQPDVARVWSKVSAVQKKQRKIVPWVTHLAAVFVGVLIALSFLLFNKKPQQNIVEVIRTPNTPQVVHDTVPQAVVVTNEPKKEVGLNRTHAPRYTCLSGKVDKTKPLVTEMKQDNPEDNKPEVITHATPNVITEHAPVKTEVASVQKPVVKPVYLSDIEESNSRPVKMNAIQKMIDANQQMLATKFSTITYTESPNPVSFFRSFSNNK